MVAGPQPAPGVMVDPRATLEEAAHVQPATPQDRCAERCAALTCVLPSAGPHAAAGARRSDDFVRRDGSELRLHGKALPFRWHQQLLPDVQVAAHGQRGAERCGQRRFPGSCGCGARSDIGDPNDPSTSRLAPADGVYFQYWDAAAGARGVQRRTQWTAALDYVLAQAGALGLKLVIPFVNNWNDFGGMDQYVLAGATTARRRPRAGTTTASTPTRSGGVVQELDRPPPQPDEHEYGHQSTRTTRRS